MCAGVGKSRTIQACAQWAEKLLRRAGPYLPRVLILGPTGASAALIGNNMINCHIQSFSLHKQIKLPFYNGALNIHTAP